MAKSAKTSDGLPPDALTLNRHPHAHAQIQRLRAWAGIGALALTIFLSLRAGVPAAAAWLRGLAGGVVAFMVTWAISVAVWRQLALAQVEAARRRLAAARQAAIAATRAASKKADA
ncbi:MAG TPA: hypothetical protein VI111_05370 [Thermoleophilaceae bacterium]